MALVLLSASAQAATIRMDPDTIDWHWETQFEGLRGGDLSFRLLHGDSDGMTSRLVFEYDIYVYSSEPGGIFSFDTPVIDTRSSNGFFMFTSGDGIANLRDNEVLWLWAAACCVGSNRLSNFREGATLTIDLDGVPTSAVLFDQPVTFGELNGDGSDTSVPEPVSSLLLAVGALVIGAARRESAG